MMFRFSAKGFTLIELLIVLVLIGLATSFVLPNMWKQFDQAKLYSEKKQLNAIITFAKEYSVYKGGSLKLVFKDNSLAIYEQNTPKIDLNINEVDDDVFAKTNEQELKSDEDKPESVERLVKKIEFNTLTVQENSYILDAQSYFKKLTLTVTVNKTGKSEKIEV
ncbi:prepilin-type N-terminal cleavage/methylation domain-containing protein [Pseudoalteromonas carrageenovora]|uniref:prepilin-type N-terminal cleavage/methylation domain-containing protein n=1 Tax=Pseudoalteromonas carrageenovora TaxID=227 RepID=UPI002FD347D2